MNLVTTAPGKLIISGEYAVLDGAPAVVLAVDRRVAARVEPSSANRTASVFLSAVATELRERYGADDPATRAAAEIVVDSAAFYADGQKLGLGSSAAVTVAATQAALAERAMIVNRSDVLAVALAAHAAAQSTLGAAGSGADVASAVHGGVIVYTVDHSTGPAQNLRGPSIVRRSWPASVTLMTFFTGQSADTATLVQLVDAARRRPDQRDAVEAALVTIADASTALAAALGAPAAVQETAVIGALKLCAIATDRLATAAGVPLVPPCVAHARSGLAALGGTAKTTGAGGGDVGIAVIPATADVTEAERILIEAGCKPLALRLDETGVDTRPVAQ